MPISLNEFNSGLLDQLGQLPERVLAFLKSRDEAFTAEEVTAELLNIRANRLLLAPEVAAALPSVRQVLEGLVADGEVLKREITKLAVARTYYAKKLAQ